MPPSAKPVSIFVAREVRLMEYMYDTIWNEISRSRPSTIALSTEAMVNHEMSMLRKNAKAWRKDSWSSLEKMSNPAPHWMPHMPKSPRSTEIIERENVGGVHSMPSNSLHSKEAGALRREKPRPPKPAQEPKKGNPPRMLRKPAPPPPEKVVIVVVTVVRDASREIVSNSTIHPKMMMMISIDSPPVAVSRMAPISNVACPGPA
mmetsp:Transcript_5403/g.10881  ORF Transcript_5403/g.10881 Transcript_5403/m.10881 type:complete len:204 (-) Transcript_5403:1494-2105(-)